MKEELLAFYKEYKEIASAYELALNTLYFDQATIAPKDGADHRNRMTAILSGEYYSHKVDENAIQKIVELSKMDNEPELAKELKLLLRDLEETRVIPKAEFVAFEQIVADSQTAWEKAKKNNDYQIFKPHLINVIKKKKALLAFIPKTMSDYDYMLDEYQLGMNTEKYDAFFAEIKKYIPPLIKQIQEAKKSIATDVLEQPFAIEQQEQFMEKLNTFMQVNYNECYMATSTHPFTSFFSAHDVRLTTHYYEDKVMSAILSTIHEYGHAKYSLQVKEAYQGTSLFSNIGFAMHESQSRFLENHIGRSEAFWKVNYPTLQEQFPTQLKDVSFTNFLDMINIARPSLIRTEADELTYPLHILIRYELEKEIFSGTIDYEKLDELWADKYEEYLGIRPTTHNEGILQDMHWGAANLGYFPTYALGSAYAAQFYHQLEKEMDVEKVLANKDFKTLTDWLQTNIHQYGAFKDADDILLDVTGETFNPSYYTAYLTSKFKKIYNLD